MAIDQTQPPAPVITNEPVEVADGVYVIPDGHVPFVPNVGIILGSRAALVVDTGMGPQNGATVLRHAQQLADGRPLLLTITHFHPEHSYGAQAFTGDAVSVYNSEQLDEFHQKGVSYLELFKSFGDAVATQLEGVELVDPQVAYDGSARLDLGGRTALLEAWGPAHSRGDQTVFVPEVGVLFTGDLVEEGCFAILPWFPPDDVDVDGDRWISVLEQLERLEPDVVVPGHGRVGDVETIATARAYIELLRTETERLVQQGHSEDEIASELDRAMRLLHPDWVQPEWIELGARYFSYWASSQDAGEPGN